MSFDIQNLLFFSYVLLHLLQTFLFAGYLWRQQCSTTAIDPTSYRTLLQDRPSGTTPVADGAEWKGAVHVDEARTEVGHSQTDASLPPLFSEEELATARQHAMYAKDHFHFAVLPSDIWGRDALIRAFLGLSDPDPAEIEIPPEALETIFVPQISRNPDPNPDRPYVWYEVLARGCLNMSERDYFKSLSLYVFDGVLVQVDVPFTLMQAIVLANCQRYNIRTYIVWSHVDECIRTITEEMGDDAKAGQVMERDRLSEAVREKFVQEIQETRKHIRANIKLAGLSEQRVYIVSRNRLRRIMQKEPESEDLLDELELCKDLFTGHTAGSAYYGTEG